MSEAAIRRPTSALTASNRVRPDASLPMIVAKEETGRELIRMPVDMATNLMNEIENSKICYICTSNWQMKISLIERCYFVIQSDWIAP